jgi:lipopolysaccharide transport system ATP-binding protein
MKPILEIQDVSKKFTLNHQGIPYLSLRDKFSHLFRAKAREEFWALKDVSFRVHRGESIGIIGRNGAGKSTLLKILSRITPPTQGRVVSRGRIASLLEVGTGFHQELTGRENIFMNGSILGMKRTEIKRKFDEIVDFSGTEKFLDTQLKHYSSGMQLRLAFSVAAHLEPEVLIIDEVLAVGDAEFQKKCLGKMGEVIGQGRTLLFVSHNLEVIGKLCARGILLDQGMAIADGSVNEVLSTYQAALVQNSILNISERVDRIGNGILKFKHISMADASGKPITSVFSGQACQFIIEFENKGVESAGSFQLDVGVTSEKDEKLTWFSTSLSADGRFSLSHHHKNIYLVIDPIPLMPGKYWLTLFCKYNGEIADWVSNAFLFSVEAGDFYGSGKLNNKEWGYLLLRHTFKPG